MLHGPLADNSCLDYGNDWDLSDLAMFGAPDSRPALKADFDRLCVTCELVGVAKSATITDVVAVAEAWLQSQQKLPLQVALVKSQAKRISALSACCTSLEGTIAESQSSATQILTS